MIADFVIAPQGRHCHCHNICRIFRLWWHYCRNNTSSFPPSLNATALQKPVTQRGQIQSPNCVDGILAEDDIRWEAWRPSSTEFFNSIWKALLKMVSCMVLVWCITNRLLVFVAKQRQRGDLDDNDAGWVMSSSFRTSFTHSSSLWVLHFYHMA